MRLFESPLTKSCTYAPVDLFIFQTFIHEHIEEVEIELLKPATLRFKFLMATYHTKNFAYLFFPLFSWFRNVQSEFRHVFFI